MTPNQAYLARYNRVTRLRASLHVSLPAPLVRYRAALPADRGL